ncbi:MAG: 50S ribosomal protein L25, partial [Isosphaeraceae bacterium]
MAEALKLRVEPRDPAKNKGTGTRAVRRLRRQGRIPAVIY